MVEEAAQAGINAVAIGGPVELPEEMRAAALQRAMAYAAAGTATPESRRGLGDIS